MKVSGATDVFYIVPPSLDTDTKTCPQMGPEESCLTLQEFANNSGSSTISYNSINLTLFFLEGKHYLNNTITISDISGISAFSMISSNDTYDTTSIECSGLFQDADFKFLSVHSVHIRGLTFFGCESETESVQNLIIEQCTFWGVVLPGPTFSGTSLTISDSMADITDTQFILNVWGTYRDHVEFLPNHHRSTNIFYTVARWSSCHSSQQCHCGWVPV